MARYSETLAQGACTRRLIAMIDYKPRSRLSASHRIAAWFGIGICILVVLLGLVAAWYGADGIHYAVSNAPSRDRDGDLFGAGVLTLIGIMFTLFGCRWSWQLFRRLRHS